jgi:hypothetical protein
MSAQLGLHSCPKKLAGHFPGDPRYSSTTLSATAEAISCLGQDVFLSTAVLDCIIQRTAVLPELSQDLVPPMIGSFGYEEFMLSSNLTASFPREKFSISAAWKVHNEKVLKLRTSLAGILHHQPNSSSSVRQRLIIPIVKARHFFVACFVFLSGILIFLLKFPFTTHWRKATSTEKCEISMRLVEDLQNRGYCFAFKKNQAWQEMEQTKVLEKVRHSLRDCERTRDKKDAGKEKKS